MKHALHILCLSTLSATTLGLHALAGGIEHYCVTGGAEVIEQWAQPTNVPWNVCTGPAANFLYPGAMPTTCLQAIDWDDSKYPGNQSILRAAKSWADASAIGPFQTPGTFSMETTFGHVPWPTGQPFPQLTLLTNPPTLPRENLITFWEPAASFTFYGGAFAVGVAAVDLDVPTGTIRECDIALQAATVDPVSGFPLWSWVEDNTLLGSTVASTAGFGAPFGDPTLGYVDMQGVLTHEIGHFAGLGHSVLDSSAGPNASAFPTMFQFTQTFTFNSLVQFHTGPGCGMGTKEAMGSQTLAKGMLGRSAATLAPDDVGAILGGYPPAGGHPSYGKIQGTIALYGVPLRGASIVAISTTDPENNRVGTLSYDNGAFQIDGLSPGHYYVYAEPVDQDPSTASSSEYYFPNALVPNYVFLGPYAGGSGFSVCTPYQYFTTDFFDPNEGTFPQAETSFTQVSGVAVTASGTTTVNFNVESVGDMLTVDDLSTNPTAPRPSARGVWVPFNATALPMVNFQVSGAAPNKRVIVWFDTVLAPQIVNGQLRLVGDGVGAGAPLKVSGFTDAFGNFSYQLQLKATQGLRNVFAQSAVGVGAQQKYSNVVNVWVTRP